MPKDAHTDPAAGTTHPTDTTDADFVLVERRAAAPMLDPTLFRIPTFVGALSISFLSRFVTVGSSVYFLLYFQGVLDLSPLESGLLLLPIFVPQLCLGLVAGRLQGRFAAAHIIAAGLPRARRAADGPGVRPRRVLAGAAAGPVRLGRRRWHRVESGDVERRPRPGPDPAARSAPRRRRGTAPGQTSAAAYPDPMSTGPTRKRPTHRGGRPTLTREGIGLDPATANRIFRELVLRVSAFVRLNDAWHDAPPAGLDPPTWDAAPAAWLPTDPPADPPSDLPTTARIAATAPVDSVDEQFAFTIDLLVQNIETLLRPAH
ncbi:hypothetical protein [Embleya sp. MST-111070]|uniref:hypothetical protein n=1 Tax=Embleya sp. MST-111070 TaxID=3398231 RepID=UPI003F735AF6